MNKTKTEKTQIYRNKKEITAIVPSDRQNKVVDLGEQRLGESAQLRNYKISTVYNRNLNMKYRRIASLLAGDWLPVGPHGHYESYTGVDHLFYELVAVTIFEKKLQLGMLNPYAEPFVPQENNDENNQEK